MKAEALRAQVAPSAPARCAVYTTQDNIQACVYLNCFVLAQSQQAG